MFRIAVAPIAAALAVTAAPAAAQSLGGAYYASSKTQAILGGESRLAAILAQQSGQAAAQPAGLAPAGYGAPLMRAAMPVYRPAIAMDQPDVFNSVALPIDRTSLDRRWRKVANAPASAGSTAFASALSGRSPIERLEAVNRYVNQRVRFVDDIRQYGVADHWTSAADTLRRGRGDCEDYAIAKLQLLRRAGFADKDLYLVILHDSLRRADHAVLVARADDRLLVLDNGTDRLIDSHDMPDYRPIVSFSGNRAWIHGYRREAPPMVLASNQVAPATALSAGITAAPAPSAQAN
ncbi:MAG TPA: transglutaminase-like cysteine peptidase [Sphingomicrobium sp.]|jgi:predicted transglutaminase-like cysteine proteinase|nr:transglutaminase-like cysteine peptidase [Sphingomicrobium sp.]